MRVNFELGSEIDIVTGDELDSKLKGLGDSIISKIPPSRARPLRITAVASQVAVANQTCTLIATPGGPAAGRIWMLTQFVVTGGDDSTSVANAKAAGYIGDPANPSLAGLVFPGTAVPTQQPYSEKTIWVHFGESVFVNVYGAAGGTTLSLVVRAMDMPERVAEASMI